MGPFGGSGGDIFDTDQFLEIKILSGIAVDAVIITYLVNRRMETCRFGGEGGKESLQVYQTLLFWVREFCTYTVKPSCDPCFDKH